MPQIKKSELKRAELLDKGLALMWERGFNGISVRDIVDAAGVPKGSFYFYFDSKDQFALEVLKKYLEITDKAVPFPCKVEGSPLQGLRHLYELRAGASGKDSCRKGCLLVNIANELGASNDGLRLFIASHWEQARGPIQELLQEAIDANEIDARFDAAELASFMETTWMGALTSAKAKQDVAELDRVIDFMFGKMLA